MDVLEANPRADTQLAPTVAYGNKLFAANLFRH